MRTAHQSDQRTVKRHPATKEIMSDRSKRMVEALPHTLLDMLIERMQLKNDAAL